MSQTMSQILTVNYPHLQAPFQSLGEVIEVELAERSLKHGLFAQYASARVARSVAHEVVALCQLSLEAGSLEVFQAQFKWEIGVVLTLHHFYKYKNDMALIAILQAVMLEKFSANLGDDIKAFTYQIRAMFFYCWKEAEQSWRGELAAKQ